LKKFKFFVSLIFLILFLVAGCAKKAEKTEIKEIEFWTLQLSNFAPYINGVIKDYEKIHPDVKIKWIDVPFSEGEKRALASVMSKNVPDLINMNPSFASTLASRGALIDLREYINSDQLDVYLKESLAASALKENIFGIPWYITSSITIYNTEFLADAGINADNIPKTYEELGVLAEKIKKKTGKYAFMPNLIEDGHMLKIFNKYDVPVISDDRTKALFNTLKAQEILSFWVDLYEKKYIPPESLTEAHRASLEKFQAGESAFIFSGANFLKIISENAPQVYKNTSVTPQITGSNKKVDFALMNLVIPKKSKYIKEAVDFGLFLTNTKNQLEFCKLAPILPSTKEAINSDMFKIKAQQDMMQKARAISANQLNHALNPIPPMENQKDLYQIIDNMTQEVLLKEKTPEQALENAAEEWNKILKSN